jgi:hypothetical protein
MAKTILPRYIPAGYNEQQYPEVNAVVYVGEKSAMGYSGKRSRHDFYLRFQSNEHRDQHIQKYVEGLQRTMEYKAERKKSRPKSDSATTATAIKLNLKAIFPGVKFSVRSDNFSMGDSVDISWTDGPKSDLVDLIADMYQSGSFDGMTDMYNYCDIDQRLKAPGAKYVSTHRNLSEDFKKSLLPYLRKYQPEETWRSSSEEFDQYSRSTINRAEYDMIGKNEANLKDEIRKLQEAYLDPKKIIQTKQPKKVKQPVRTDQKVISLKDSPASKRQLWALHCITKLDTRNCIISLQQADELIKKANQGFEIKDTVRQLLAS